MKRPLPLRVFPDGRPHWTRAEGWQARTKTGGCWLSLASSRSWRRRPH